MVTNMMTATKIYMVHSFKVSDSEDPDLYAAQPLYKWEQSEEGKWIMTHAADIPTWHRIFGEYNFIYEIHARLTSSDYLYWKLKFK